MANSTLHLIVAKGPKQGETLARRAGTQIRIGRVVKGNTFPIKDPGISQKHLTIEFVSEISRWIVEDLDTSNGTFINDAKIPSSTPFPLSDGDNIKIGETTLISIKIDGDGEVDGGLRQGQRRVARFTAESLDSVAEVEDNEGTERNVEFRVEEPKNMARGRPRRGNSSRISKKDAILDAVAEDSVEARPRRAGLRTRAASARISKEEGASEINAEAASVAVLKKNELLDSIVEDNIEAPKNVKRGWAKRAPPRTRTLSAKVLQADELHQCDSLAEEVSEKGELNIESNTANESKEEGASEINAEAGSMGVSKKNELLDSVVEDNIEAPKNVKRGGAKRAPPRTRTLSAKVQQADELHQCDSLAEEVSEKGELNIESNTTNESKEEGASEINAEAGSMGVSKKNELLDSVVEDNIEAPKNVKRGRAKRAPPRTRTLSAKVLQADELHQCDSLAEEVSEKGELNIESNTTNESKEVGSKEREKGKTVEEETIVDFEKMTLGEWFDSMDKCLPQAINEVAEQMIATLREKARLYDEYVANVPIDG